MSRHDPRQADRLALQLVESDCGPAREPSAARRLARVEPLRAADGAACGYRVRLDNGIEADLPLDGTPRLH